MFTEEKAIQKRIPRRLLLAMLLVVAAVLASGCSTRQVYDKYSGSTAQRLVTYSIHKLAKDIKDEDFAHLRGKRVHMNSHFVVKTDDLQYAHDYFVMEFRRRFQMEFVEESEADYIFDLFFSSLGTDQDTFGLSIPLVNLGDTSAEAVKIDILAMDMYHGITEAKLYVTNVSTQTIQARKKMLARVRTDKVSTPIFSFPINSLED